jgi:hypothetical protein
VNRTQRVRRFRLASATLSLGAILVAGSLMTALPALAAGTGTVRIDPSTAPAAGPGSTFTISVISNAAVTTTGIQASVTFDKSLLQIMSVARPGTDWGTGTPFIGPSGDLTIAANLATAIAQANGTGKLSTVATQLPQPQPPTPANVIAANSDATFLLVTFVVVACPTAPATTTPINLPVGPGDTALNDGTGDPVTVTATGTTVTPCSSSTGNTTTHVTSSLDAGFLALEVAPNYPIPLIRQVNNSVDVPVKIFSDGIWTLNVSDSMPAGKLASDRGHMTQDTPYARLANPMTAQHEAEALRTLDQPFANTNVTSGAGTATPVITLRQLVTPADPAGTFSIPLTFTATSGF